MDEKTREIYEKYGINPEEREIENRKIIEERYNNIDSENKAFLDSLFKKALEENFEHFKHYLRNPRFYYFTDLKSTIGEIVKCLITESHTAAITLTNHFLERILKLALIQKASGTQPKKITDWNKTYSVSDKYSNWKMGATIKKCKELKIISKTQFKELTEFQETIRNGFSHYDPKKILRDSENTIDLIDKSDSDSKKIVGLNYKEIPTLQNFFVREFARDNSEEYFDYVFNLILSIEKHFKIEYYNNAK
ncbi:hypothetical protein [Cellulophaga lytica]|uniref:Uncharacterized protein n=1 Tax=Cellulophaga lytica (strain ATCC 23178 / DSM 7489 / JCM 8516 / NBRC 14961 / NCIMB 1423 / VKM B-1433 / Cy l20) TaxID=867900 RepID=F0RII9_CELLC|nr:hypothetical protein [Cellulophaga lytica]ADY29318.1 hypothetical protein Celly_1494 [Cellulophaga lytica DSM 7489]WQG76507.1 hypothetical protein SR888_12520 [Cellulophaga lytica]SNQ44738.1 conserved hypothetical protein [Cellulophaga lytica]